MRFSNRLRWILPALMMLLAPAASISQIAITVSLAPPVLPVYEQPLCPEQGLMWSPGYWAWSDDGYYWVPGEWVPAPYAGALWTPPWWAWDNGRYAFHDGYWGDRVGYYGGIDYGFGYMGIGFVGGEWRGGVFAYNTAVMRVNTSIITNTYVNRTIVRSNTIINSRHVAFNGGPNGIHHDPTPAERTAMSGRHTPPTSVQQQHIASARADKTSFAKANGGHPHTLAVAGPATGGRTATTARGAHEGAPAGRETARPATAARNTSAERTAHGTESKSTAARAETRSSAARPEAETRSSRSTSETRAAQSRSQSGTASSRTTPARTESRTAAPRTESTAKTEPRTATRTESRPAATEKPRPESRTASESRAASPSHTESRPSPQRESHPAPPRETRPAPVQHTEARPTAPERESHPAPAPKQERTKPESR